MMGGKRERQITAVPAVIDPNDVTSAQEGRVVPYFAGETLIAGLWISPVYNEFYREAPAEAPGKAK